MDGTPRQDETVRDNIGFAVAAIVLAVLVQSFGDALVKQYSLVFSLWQIYVLRSLPALVLLWVLAQLTARRRAISRRARGWAWLRSALLVWMWVAYAASLPHIKLSLAAAGFYTLPLFVTLLSALLTHDRVSGPGWLAIVAGFGGVLIILRPDAAGINVYALLPLLAAALAALAAVITRTHLAQENPLALIANLNITFLATGLLGSAAVGPLLRDSGLAGRNPFIFGPWGALGMSQFLILLLMAIVVVAFSIGIAVAYQSGPPSLVASFDYAYLPFSIVWGLLFFNEVPDALSVLGMLLIAGAGLMSVAFRAR